MRYRALKNHFIKVPGKGEQDYDAGEGAVLVPPAGSKVFLHWLTDNGKLAATYTLEYATLVQNKFKIINNKSDPVQIHCIEIGKTGY